MRALSTAACAFLVGAVACGPPPPDPPDASAPHGPSAALTGPVSARAMAATLAAEGGQPPPTSDRVMACMPEPESEASGIDGDHDEGDGGEDPSGILSPADSGSSDSPCPDGMASVDTTFCPDIERRCLDMEHEDINNINICHAFAHQQRCRVRPRRIAFCIDRYEYPNRAGAHPTWMLDWYKAQATCESKGKRLCYASEWTAACEGPDHTPFPYGWERDHTKCNIDNFFIEPKKWGPQGQFLFYSKDERVALGELSRLDQSVPSGSLEGCTSGFGVHDMTGNIDEWVASDLAPREKSLWSGLKGGAWGHVRSQCRPMTFSHDPAFSYYFVGFRCCKDADGAPPWTPSPQAMPAPSVPPHDYAPDPIVVKDAIGPSKAKFSRSGRPE